MLAGLAGLRGGRCAGAGSRRWSTSSRCAPVPVGAGQLGQFLLFTGMAAYFLVLALYLQDGRGLGPLASGTVFTAVAVPYMVGTRNAVRVLGRFGARAGDRRSRRWSSAPATRCCWPRSARSAPAARCSGWSPAWRSVAWAWASRLSGAGRHRDGLGPAAARGHRVRRRRPRCSRSANAVGVALVGIIFFGRLDHGMVDAFEASLVYLVATTVAVAVAAAFLPGRPQAAADRQVSSADGRHQLVGGRVGVRRPGHDGLGERVEVACGRARRPSARAAR